MKIITTALLKDFSGKPLLAGDQEVTVGQALSNILAVATDGGKMKLYTLAQKLYENPVVEVDGADLILIKRSVESTEIYSNIVTGQLLLLLEDTK